MIDISSKRVSKREVVAAGKLVLKRETLRAVLEKRLEKGDPFEAARVAALLAVKRVPELLPHCHTLPIEAVEVGFEPGERELGVRVKVKAQSKTGVEMEALVGVLIALATLWDMVKALEKDERGQYPSTSITDVRVVEKLKEPTTQPPQP